MSGPPPSHRPDWAIAGGASGLPGPDQAVMVWATNAPLEARLVTEIETSSYWDRPEEVVSYVHHLTISTYTYIIVLAPDYGTALRRLFESWSPGVQHQISGASLGLPRGPA